MCLYGFIVALDVVKTIIKEQGLWHVKFRNDHTGEEYKASYKTIFFFMVGKYNYLVFLVIICLVMSIALILFTVYHLYMIRGGVTTAENIKISRTLGDLSYRIEKYIEICGERVEELTKAEYVDIKHRIEVCKNLIEKINKIYGEKNFWKNFKEVLFA